jgi:hypothetical protein
MCVSMRSRNDGARIIAIESIVVGLSRDPRRAASRCHATQIRDGLIQTAEVFGASPRGEIPQVELRRRDGIPPIQAIQLSF